ncbi:unnamed protein product [Sphagnum jensenii]|uniref:Cellulose synthase n=1 Tax=Sphagnum jensenii TaxID=128206 RepID=A0ABP0WYP6_9BRYO
MGSMIPQENQLVNLQPKPPLKQFNGVYICQIRGDDDVGVTLEARQSPPPFMDGDEQKLDLSKLKKDPIEILNNLEKQTNNCVEANKHDKQQTMVVEATMLQGHDTPSNGQTQVPSIIYDEINLVPLASMDPIKDSGLYGSVAWRERVENWKLWQEKKKTNLIMIESTKKNHHLIEEIVDFDDGVAGQGPNFLMVDESRRALSRKFFLASNKINPYRMVIIIRLVIVAFFFHYRILNPVPNAFGLWLTSVICEIWFAISWILDQFPKWFPINRETYLDRLSFRYEKEGEPSQLAHVDVFVSTMDPTKEPPLVTANVILSILGVDYPVEKISCYLSDDGASMLTFDAIVEISEFARKWVPFCKKFDIEPRAPEMYFTHKIDYLKDKREYEEFKVRVNALVAKANEMPKEGWIMQDGTPWPGNNTQNHPAMIQVLVFLGHNGGRDIDGNELPRLVYVSREKRPGFNHHKKAGAMNALVRVSAMLTNAPFILNLDCDHYINNSKALREAMCFMMDPSVGKRVCYVQFPQRFNGIDRSDRYANHNTIFFDINLKGLDGIQGPVYVGTGCVFRRRALYGYDPPTKEGNKKEIQNICSNANALLKEAIHVISCGYEDKSDWGKELGWIYGSVTEDILTGFKMHCRGWRSIYCMPHQSAFKGSAPINLSDRLNQMLRWALGSVEICLSQHCPIWYGYKGGHLKCLQRLAYINIAIYPFTALPLVAYCTLPAICLLSGKFIIPTMSNSASLWFISLFLSVFATGILEMRWSGVDIHEWWRNEQFWVISGVSAHLFAIFQGLFKMLAGINTNFTGTSKASEDKDFGELYAFKWTTLLILPTTLVFINIVGIIAGTAEVIYNGYQAWGPFFGKLLFAFWVLVHLYPFLKGLMGRQNRIPTIEIVWSLILASIFSLLLNSLTIIKIL